jgi:alkyl sulfatase BDS1-like metallo-beta-lactamase superfamily hydrolase
MPQPKQPPLAALVAAGMGQQDAVDLGGGIFMSRGVSNCYQVVTRDGVLMVNTGSAFEIPWHTDRFTRAVGRPVRVIVFTQSHADHIGGWHAFNGPGVETLAQADYPSVRGYWNRLAAFYARRTQVLWGAQIQAQTRAAGAAAASAPPPQPPDPQPTRTFVDRHAFALGERSVELLSVPGGETTDSLAVWLPESRAVFTGNLFGPMFGHVPNLPTLRGDKPRSALGFVASLERVRALGAELLITGHGDPIRGAGAVDASLVRLRDAVQWVHDRTVEGMNAGRDLHALMREIAPPPELRLGEGHGTVRWNVRAIWEEYTGWFRYESTTELYGVPQRAVAGDLVELAGGADALAKRAADYLAAGRALEALHLTDLALAAQPLHPASLRVEIGAHERLLEQSGHENLSETRWLEGRIAVARARLGEG